MINKNIIMNPQALEGIFGGVPDFIGSELMDVRLKSFERTIVLQLMTNQPIQNKPERWDKVDVVYVDMSLFDVRNLIISGDISSNSITQFDMSKEETAGILEIRCNNQMQIKCLLDWARVEKVTPGLIGSF